MKVLEFRLLSINEEVDFNYDHWSRIYEYLLCINNIKKYHQNDISSLKIHNTCWGKGGDHVKFYNTINKLNKNIVHSDIIPSKLPHTCIYNVTHKPLTEWIDNFDIVMNVSAIEEIRSNHVNILQNLLSMLKNDGLLVITFDLYTTRDKRSLDIDNVEKFLKTKIKYPDNELLNGGNSRKKNNRYKDVNVGLLIIQK